MKSNEKILNEDRRKKRKDRGKINNDEIEPLVPSPLPFNPDAKIFNCVSEETGEIIGEPYSYNDFLQKIHDISGINEELLGSFERNLKRGNPIIFFIKQVKKILYRYNFKGINMIRIMLTHLFGIKWCKEANN